jgi:hypothetical protein
MRLFVRITVAASLIGALSFSAAGAEAATAASASDFTRRVCAAVATANRSSKAPAAALKAAGQAYKTSPSATTAAGLRDALAGSIQNVDQQITTLLAAGLAAVRPTNATGLVDALSGLLQSAHGAAQQLAQRAAAIDTTSESAFTSSLQQVITETSALNSQTHMSAKSNPAFKNAAAPLRPIVRYMTTDSETCGKI